MSRIVISRSAWWVSLSCIGLLAGLSAPVSAALQTLDDKTLSTIEGEGTVTQTAVQMSLSMMINQTAPGVPNTSCVGAGGVAGTNDTFCRLGLQINNVPNWLLFKGFNGYINIPQLTLYGSAVQTSSTAAQSSLVFSMPTTFAAANANNTAIQFKNVSYTLSLAVNPCYTSSASGSGTDCNPATGRWTTANASYMAIDNQKTYYQQAVYQNTNSTQPYYSANTYDVGKETGLMGVTMNGNLYVGGQINVFTK